MNFLDSIFPFLVGNRTQLLALVMTGLKLAAAFGGLDPHTVDTVEGILIPAAGATLAAKLTRVGTIK
jgi:hypothetical protein